MSKMKDLSIDLLNAQRDNTIQYTENMTQDEFLCMLQQDYINMVDHSDMPLWVYQQYEDGMHEQRMYDQLRKENDNRIPTSNFSDLSDDDLKLLYLAQEEDIDYLCLLNGFEEDNPQD
jgi:hypothetical protein